MEKIRWTVPCVRVYPGSEWFKPTWWRGDAPAHLPDFFYELETNVYYDRIGGCWGMPVYRQRVTYPPRPMEAK